LLLLILSYKISNAVAKYFGGSGSYEGIAFLVNAIQSPIILLLAIIIFIPNINILTIPISFYAMILITIAIMANYKINILKTIIVQTSNVITNIIMLTIITI
jgi:hypothetical protein